MAAPLNVIALVSGGKDSFYTHLLTLHLGHSVVALANLHPPPSSIFSPSSSSVASDQDLNSHMYQTAGHAAVPLYARALRTPLYRAPIAGTAVSTALDYASPVAADAAADTNASRNEDGKGGDETEDLFALVARIKAAHPAANALCAGAVLSTYQRTRVESVALRLGLVPLAWLWRYPFLPLPALPSSFSLPQLPSSARLLEDIAAAGLEARVVKVASGGLDEAFLWANLADPKDRAKVARAAARFDAGGSGGAALGEGGEYETLVVAGPRGVWRGRIVVEDAGREVVRGEGGEALLKLKNARLVDDADDEEGEGGGGEGQVDGEWKRRISTPCLWDEKFERLREAIPKLLPLNPGESSRSKVSSSTVEHHRPWIPRAAITASARTLRISNLAHPDPSADAKTQAAAICTRLRALLREHGLRPADLAFVTILLRSMADFPAVNAAYGALFSAPNPPARATVSCGDANALLPDGCRVLVSAVASSRASNSSTQRDGLHVQSRSFWAPANIGPYSQAITIPTGTGTSATTDMEEEGWEEEGGEEVKVVFVAGQIPLVPSTMEPLSVHDLGLDLDDLDPREKSGADKGRAEESLFLAQTLLAAQHLWRIGAATRVSWWAGAVAFFAACPPEAARARAAIASRVWEELHARNPLPSPSLRNTDSGEDDDGDGDASGPDLWDVRYGNRRGDPPSGGSDATSGDIPQWERAAAAAAVDQGSGGAAATAEATATCFLAAEVHELPRGCAVEWLACGLRFDDDDGERGEDSSFRVSGRPAAGAGAGEGAEVAVATSKGRGSKLVSRVLTFEDASHARAWLTGAGFFGGTGEEEGIGSVGVGGIISSGVLGHAVIYTPHPHLFVDFIAQITPCRSVWAARGRAVEAGIVIWDGI